MKSLFQQLFGILTKRARQAGTSAKPNPNPRTASSKSSASPHPGLEAPNRAVEAANAIFASRHSAEEQLQFQSTPHDQNVEVQSEEWRQEGRTLRTISKSTMVLTSSGEALSPKSIKAVCSLCQTFEATLLRCSECARTLCHLCARKFVEESGTTVVFCPEHFAQASKRFDTWQAFDHAQIKTPQQPQA